MKAERTILIAILVAMAVQVLIGQNPVAELELEFSDELLEGYEWRMFAANVAGTGGSGGSDGVPGSVGRVVQSPVWLYNVKSGKVYRVFTQCGDDEGEYGCLWAMPVFKD